MDREESWNRGRFFDGKEDQHSTKRKGNCRVQAKDEESRTVRTKSVIGKWLKEFRSGQKENKIHHPLGRTCSATAGNQGSKRKLGRTMSANQKENRFNCRRERKKSDSLERNGENFFLHEFSDGEPRGFFLLGRSRDFCPAFKNGSELRVNPGARVSYLDERGLNQRGKETKRRSGAAYDSEGDGFMMPASCHRRKDGNRYRDEEIDVTSNRKTRAKVPTDRDESRRRNHDYENLTTTGREKAEGRGPRIESEDRRPSELGCGFRFEDDEEVPEEEDDDDEVRFDGNVSEAPVRDPSSLKSVKYGPGHEKYPSWPGSLRTSREKPERSRSWTDRTDYPKEKATAYARPSDKKPNPTFTNQLKTVMERCEKISPRTFRARSEADGRGDARVYLPKVDREGKTLGDEDYMVPSPPERDEPYGRSGLEIYYRGGGTVFKDDADYSTPYQDVRQARFTRADLEEYVRSYEEIPRPDHRHEGSYAQSEGYHSYVSTSELAIASYSDKPARETDRRRRDRWEEQGSAGRDSVVTTSSGSAGSTETLKWHGSMSDVSVGGSSRSKSRQLIAHSSRVPPPERHHSESILYLGNRLENSSAEIERSQHLKLFPVNTYTVRPFEETKSVISPTSVPRFSVAERISELERQQQCHKLAYLDPEKRHRVSDPTLKAIQKKALLSFYERHQHSSGLQAEHREKSSNPREQETNGRSETCNIGDGPEGSRPSSVRPAKRDPDASDGGASRVAPRAISSGRPRFPDPLADRGSGLLLAEETARPERPPKKPRPKPVQPPPLPPRSPSPVPDPPRCRIQEDRLPTPDLPPPPFPPCFPEDEISSDEPLPPPPSEAEWLLATAVPGRSSPRSRTIGDRDEIQYDQDAINRIMESNNRRCHDSQRRRSSSKNSEEKKSGQERDDKPRKNRSESRPPLPLPRDSFLSSFPESDSVPRPRKADSKTGPTIFGDREKSADGSRRCPGTLVETVACHGNFPDRNVLPSEKEEERFRRLFLERTSSKAAFLAVRREKELGLTNYEGSYKLTISPSGEFLNAGRPSCSSSSSSSLAIEKVEKIETSMERSSPDERLSPLPPEPPDLIPLGDLRSRRPREESELRDDRRLLSATEEKNAPFRKFLENRMREQETDRISGDRNERRNVVRSESDTRRKSFESERDDSRNVLDVRNDGFPDLDDSREESESERLSRDLASHLSPSDKLQGLLVLDSERKRSTDYVADVFCLEHGSGSRRRRFHKSRARKISADRPEDAGGDRVFASSVSDLRGSDPSESPTGNRVPNCRTNDSESSAYPSAGELQRKKEELMARLDKKLEILRDERIALTEESAANEELGRSVAATVSRLARPSEAAKYRLHVEETGKITSLLLGLSGRLARTENILAGLAPDDPERKTQEDKREKLEEQLREAKQLKENIDKRSDSVAKILEKYLDKDEFADYLHFIRMKAKLIVDSREVADKISLGEEQLAALKETLSS